ncbi:MAG: thermonuclease family protein [Candidatus Andersenbacteria bacterium]
MSFLFFFLTGLAGLLLLIGLVKPGLFNRLFKGTATRGKVGAWLGGATGVFFVLFVVSVVLEAPKPRAIPLNAEPRPAEAEPKAEEPKTFTVSSVVDGDTLKVKSGSDETTVRLLGIDAPELKSGGPECYAEESRQRLEELTKGKTVKLEADSSQDDKDRYDRLLRYITLEDGTNVNEKMVYGGYAYEYTYDKPYAQQAAFKAAEADAKSAKRGLWAADTCNGQREKPKAEEPAPSTPPATESTPSTPPPAPSEPPASSAYYANCTAARNAGAAPLYKGQPGYRAGLDRDGDGVACSDVSLHLHGFA